MIYWVSFALGITGGVGFVIGRAAGVRACRTRHVHDWGDWSLRKIGLYDTEMNVRQCESCGLTEALGLRL